MLLLFMINTQTVLTKKKKRANPEECKFIYLFIFLIACSRVCINWTDSLCKLQLLCSPPPEDLVVRSMAKLMRCAIAR